MKKQTAGRDALGAIAPKFAALNDDVLFGEVWSRSDRLSLRDRSIVTVTALIAKGIFDNSLKYHLANARNNGVTAVEMAELITHLAFYAGWPNAWGAFAQMKEVMMAQKDPNEKWVIIVNEFGEIGIDGAVLSDNGIPVAEIAGGCLCCTAGAQMGTTVQKMLRDAQPDRLMIEASGLAHAASVIDELKAKPLDSMLEIGAVFTVVDPRQFINPDYAQQALYKDQIGICDVLVASKTDLCTPEQLAEFHDKAAKLFPPKAKVVEVQNAQLDIQWLDIPVVEKSRYRLKALPDNTMGFQSQGFTFPAGRDFDGEKLTDFFNDLPKFTDGLVRAKGVFQVLGTWVWLNWVDGQWGANQVSWRRDSRFELIAKSFDADLIEKKLLEALEK